MSLLGISWGFEKSFLAIYEGKRESTLIVVKAGVGERLSSSLDQSLGAKIRAVPGVRAAEGSLVDTVSFEDANLTSVVVNGWEPGSLLFKGIRLLDGKLLTTSDGRAVMLGRILSINLGKKAGTTLDISGEPFKVVGTYESDSLFENGGMVMSLAEVQRRMGREGDVSGFVVAAEKTDLPSVQALSKQIEKDVPGVAASPARDFVQGDNQIRLVKSMSWATSLIAMLLGSVGVLNTMMMTVFERTREIGILRALGWRRTRVLNLIMGEAAMLGLTGAILGSRAGVPERENACTIADD